MPIRTLRSFIAEFIQLESAGGILLFFMAVLALILANSPLSAHYTHFIDAHIKLAIGLLVLDKSLLHWINDGLMVIFFLLVGLEIKREIFEGGLSSIDKMMLPTAAAIGGMLCPALVYYYFNHGDSYGMRGWAIPTATDIAFALSVLTLLGNRVPVSLKIFLTALAILDDLGAIVIIAIFYTADINFQALMVAGVALVVLILMNLFKVRKLTPYMLVGLVLWFFVLKSGVHATVAGVLLAFTIPLGKNDNVENSPLRRLEHNIHPWVAFLILPLFAFANSGISLTGVGVDVLLHSVPMGITLGLFLGKQLGVFIFSWLAIQLRIARLPTGANYLSLYGIGLLCGIGFTMSLFIGGLAFGTVGEHSTMIRLGVFAGSFLSGILGYFILYFNGRKRVIL